MTYGCCNDKWTDPPKGGNMTKISLLLILLTLLFIFFGIFLGEKTKRMRKQRLYETEEWKSRVEGQIMMVHAMSQPPIDLSKYPSSLTFNSPGTFTFISSKVNEVKIFDPKEEK